MKKWNNLPEFMRNDEVKKYYDILQHKKISLFIKRLFDIILSSIGLIIISPILIIVSIIIKIDSKGPIFFRQERVTTNNRTFKIFKFRTMVENADKIGTLVTVGEDKRITKVGKFIRKCKIDELPQLINILIGDMTFIGTRPEVRKYVDCYTDEMKATLLMRAGVTSIASIKFRNESEIMDKYMKKEKDADKVYIERVLPEKMKYNLEYIEKFNMFYDLGTIINTILAIIGLKKFD